MLYYLVTGFLTSEFKPSVLPAHDAFLERLRQQRKLELAGPFTDRSGGAYIIRAENLEEARAVVSRDPLHTTKSSTLTVYEWNAK